MKLVLGCDLVFLPRFKKSLKSGGGAFLRRVFHLEELENKDPTHLAGIFAAKEAVMKALDLKPGNWQKILIKKNASGKPSALILEEKIKIRTSDLSISHDGNYALAIFIGILL